MTTNPEIQRQNLKHLSDESGGVGKLAEKLGKSFSQVSQWLNGSKNSGTGKSRGMRPETARFIEITCGKKRGWMDIDHEIEVILGAEEIMETDNDVNIPQYHDVGGAMGHGVLLRDQPGEIHGWRVTADWIDKNVRNHSGIQNLAIVTGFGDSMKGMYNPGDPLLVDAGVKTVDFDAVYFFRVGNEGFIKRLQRIPGDGIIVISENKAYRDWTIKPEMDFEVFARVIKVWQGTDF